jgi:hypothetical protein
MVFFSEFIINTLLKRFLSSQYAAEMKRCFFDSKKNFFDFRYAFLNKFNRIEY